MKTPHTLKPATRCVHGGRSAAGGLSPSIAPAAVYAFENLDRQRAAFAGENADYIYARFRHPTGEAVEARLAALEDAPGAVLCSGGMAALWLTLSAHCRPGDHVLAGAELYGGTTELLGYARDALGLEVEFVPVTQAGDLGSRVRDNTALILLESPSNPLLRLADFDALFAGLPRPRPLTVLDGTLATPLGQRALAAGFDLVLHSATKYLGGHDDLTAGAVMGREELVEPIRRRRQLLGSNCDPQTAWLLHRGMQTLAVRWDRQCANALTLAQRLEAHDAVDRVYYPGLPSHPQHELAAGQMQTFGALLAFAVSGGQAAAERIFDRLELIARAPSLGGVESMMLHPVTASHRGLSEQERETAGITGSLLRLSCGIEDADDVWADLEQALEGA